MPTDQLYELLKISGVSISYVWHRRRLQQLFHHGFIDRPREQKRLWIPAEKDNRGNTIAGTGGSKKMLYALGDLGARELHQALAEERIADLPDQAVTLAGKWTTKNREIRADTLRHLLMINSFYVVLARACAGTGISLEWRSEWEWPPAEEEERVSNGTVYIDVTRDLVRTKLFPSDAPLDTEGGRPNKPIEIPINPDAFFTLSWKGRGGQPERLAFFLEADRASEVVAGRRRSLLKRSLYRKYVGYWNWLVNERGHKNFDLDGFSVLTVTTSRQRAENFSSAAAAAVSKRPPKAPLFWATAESDYFSTDADPVSRVTGPIWLSEKGDPGKHHPFEHAPF